MTSPATASRPPGEDAIIAVKSRCYLCSRNRLLPIYPVCTRAPLNMCCNSRAIRGLRAPECARLVVTPLQVNANVRRPLQTVGKTLTITRLTVALLSLSASPLLVPHAF